MNIDINIPFSVAMSVYGRDNADWFAAALESVVRQTVRPDEIVLIEDGPVPDAVRAVVEKYSEICLREGILFSVIPLERNQGLGNALRIAVEKARNGIVARMDSDDIALPDRFEKQLALFSDHPELSIAGGNITEFIGEPTHIVAQRQVPQTDAEIKRYMKRRCGFNHMTVMFRKSEVLRAGNYQDWFYNEDYYLWIRMMQAGCVFANMPDILVNVRVGKDAYARRGGSKYYRSERDLQRYMYKAGIISWSAMVANIGVRFIVQRLMPNWLRGFVFRTIFRKK